MFRNPLVDLVLALVVVLLVFGPKRLPSLGKSLGHGIREFKDGITGKSTPDDEDRPALNAAQESPTVTAERESAEVGSTDQRA